MLGADAVDESHVHTDEGPCRGRIELRTLHKNLPESRRTLREAPSPTEFGPTLADFSTLATTNFTQIHARHILTQRFVAQNRFAATSRSFNNLHTDRLFTSTFSCCAAGLSSRNMTPASRYEEPARHDLIMIGEFARNFQALELEGMDRAASLREENTMPSLRTQSSRLSNFSRKTCSSTLLRTNGPQPPMSAEE